MDVWGEFSGPQTSGEKFSSKARAQPSYRRAWGRKLGPAKEQRTSACRMSASRTSVPSARRLTGVGGARRCGPGTAWRRSLRRDRSGRELCIGHRMEVCLCGSRRGHPRPVVRSGWRCRRARDGQWDQRNDAAKPSANRWLSLHGEKSGDREMNRTRQHGRLRRLCASTTIYPFLNCAFFTAGADEQKGPCLRELRRPRAVSRREDFGRNNPNDGGPNKDCLLRRGTCLAR
jgi:hypothetical protein